MTNTNADVDGGNSGSDPVSRTEQIIKSATDAVKVPAGSCAADNHDWYTDPSNLSRYCLRCASKQQAVANDEVGVLGCTRVEGHDWQHPIDGDTFADADAKRCMSCGLEQCLIRGIWCTWIAVGGRVNIKPKEEIEHERINRPDPPVKDPRHPMKGKPAPGKDPDPFLAWPANYPQGKPVPHVDRLIKVEVLAEADVANPTHYQGLDGTDIFDMFRNFGLDSHHRCAAIEYIMRAGRKGDQGDDIRDIKKAIEHLCRDVERRTGVAFARVGRGP